MTITPAATIVPFEAFLSHRYRSPEINLHFFRLFSQVGEVQFEVDEGSTPISMTRLSRMVRDADAFIGIYPLPTPPAEQVDVATMMAASRYFRIELSLALRNRKPTIIFYDERYRALLGLPPGVHQQSYDVQEITGAGGTPSERQHLLAFAGFCRAVASGMVYRADTESLVLGSSATVGLLLPEADHGYDDALVCRLNEILADRGYRVVRLPWPPRIGVEFLAHLRTLDWIVTDPGDDAVGAAALGFLDGNGIPVLRLRHQSDAVDPTPVAEQVLFGSFDAGYNEDRIVWSEPEQLAASFQAAVLALDAPVRRISTSAEAEAYFTRAQLRKQRVFLSYASEDAWAARAIGDALRSRFQQVFDYKDGASLPGGSPWLREIYDRLGDAQIGIPLLSGAYLSKGTCMHEAEDMAISADSNRMRVFPVNLDGTNPPSFLRNVQFLTLEPSGNAAAVVAAILERFDASIAERPLAN